MSCTCLALVAVAGDVRLSGQEPASPSPLTYTQQQADDGQAVYRETCESCHGENMDDGEFAPPLKGVDFRERWRSKTPDELFVLTSATMPQDRPGWLDADAYAQLLAFMF